MEVYGLATTTYQPLMPCTPRHSAALPYGTHLSHVGYTHTHTHTHDNSKYSSVAFYVHFFSCFLFFSFLQRSEHHPHYLHLQAATLTFKPTPWLSFPFLYCGEVFSLWWNPDEEEQLTLINSAPGVSLRCWSVSK